VGEISSGGYTGISLVTTLIWFKLEQQTHTVFSAVYVKERTEKLHCNKNI